MEKLRNPFSSHFSSFSLHFPRCRSILQIGPDYTQLLKSSVTLSSLETNPPPPPPLFVLFFSLFTSYYSPRLLLCNPHKRIMAIIKWHHSLPRPATNFLEISTFVRRFQFLHNRFHSSIPVKCHGSDVGVAKNCCSKIFYAVS